MSDAPIDLAQGEPLPDDEIRHHLLAFLRMLAREVVRRLAAQQKGESNAIGRDRGGSPLDCDTRT
jgi:hypothetical protein